MRQLPMHQKPYASNALSLVPEATASIPNIQRMDVTSSVQLLFVST